MRFRSPPDRSTLSGRDRNDLVEADLLRLGHQQCRHLGGVAPGRLERFTQRVHQAHPRYLDRVLQGQEQAGASSLPCGHAQQVGPVQADGARRYLVTGPAGHDVGKRGLARAVRAHHGVHFPAAYGQVHTPQNFLPVDAEREDLR